MNEHKNQVGCVSRSIKEADQDIEKTHVFSLSRPTGTQLTMAELQTITCKKIPIHKYTSNELVQKPCWMSLEVHQKSRSGH